MEDKVYKIKCIECSDERRVGKYVKKISGSGYIEFGKRVSTAKLWTSLLFVEKAFDKCESYVERSKGYIVRDREEGREVTKRVVDDSSMKFVIEEI